MYSIRHTGLLRRRYHSRRLIYGTFPEKLKTDTYPLME